MKFCVYDLIENNREVMKVHGVACIMLKTGLLCVVGYGSVMFRGHLIV